MKESVQITAKQIAVLADMFGDLGYAINADRFDLSEEEVSAIRVDAIKRLFAAQDLVHQLRCELGPWQEVDPVLKPMFEEMDRARSGAWTSVDD